MANLQGSMNYLPLVLSLCITIVASSRIQVHSEMVAKTMDNQTLKYDDYVKTLSKFTFSADERNIRMGYYEKLISMNKIWNSIGSRSYNRGLTGFSLLTGLQFGKFLQGINGPGGYFGAQEESDSGYSQIDVDCTKTVKKAIRKRSVYMYSNYFSLYHSLCNLDDLPSTSEEIEFVYTPSSCPTQPKAETPVRQESAGIAQKTNEAGTQGGNAGTKSKLMISQGVADVSVTDFDCSVTYQDQNLDCTGDENPPSVEERLVMILESMKQGSSPPAYGAFPSTCQNEQINNIGISDYRTISGCSSFEAALNGSLFSDGQGRQVIVLVNAGNWQHYKEGVLIQDMTDIANHYVVLTGMDKNEGTWRVENSWGDTWGENGNARIAMGVDQEWEVNPFCYKGYVFY